MPLAGDGGEAPACLDGGVTASLSEDQEVKEQEPADMEVDTPEPPVHDAYMLETDEVVAGMCEDGKMGVTVGIQAPADPLRYECNLIAGHWEMKPTEASVKHQQACKKEVGPAPSAGAEKGDEEEKNTSVEKKDCDETGARESDQDVKMEAVGGQRSPKEPQDLPSPPEEPIEPPEGPTEPIAEEALPSEAEGPTEPMAAEALPSPPEGPTEPIAGEALPSPEGPAEPMAGEALPSPAQGPTEPIAEEALPSPPEGPTEPTPPEGPDPPVVSRREQFELKPPRKPKAKAKSKAKAKAEPKAAPSGVKRKHGTKSSEVVDLCSEDADEAEEEPDKKPKRGRPCKAKAKAKCKAIQPEPEVSDPKEEASGDPQIVWTPVSREGKIAFEANMNPCQVPLEEKLLENGGLGRANEGGGDKMGAPKTEETSPARLKSFARRTCPKSSPARERWIAVRDVFEETVKPVLIWFGYNTSPWEAIGPNSKHKSYIIYKFVFNGTLCRS